MHDNEYPIIKLFKLHSRGTRACIFEGLSAALKTSLVQTTSRVSSNVVL
jgi:hypothetical protein